MANSAALVLCMLALQSVVSNHFVLSQFPVECLDDTSLANRKCCPTVSIGGANHDCGGPGRGSCKSIPDSHCHTETSSDPADILAYLKNTTYEPSRYPWPNRVFTQVCECEGDWAGYNCDECKFGYVRTPMGQGGVAQCVKRQTPLVRRNFLTLSPSERDQVQNVVAASRNRTGAGKSRFGVLVDESHFPGTPGTSSPSQLTSADFKTDISTYEFMAWIHYFAAKDSSPPPAGWPNVTVDFAHEAPTFLAWHRLYMLLFETELQMVSGNSSFALPYWDWLDNSTRSTLLTENKFGNTSALTGVLADFTITCRIAAFSPDSPRRGNGSLCTRAEFDSTVKVSRDFGRWHDETQFLPSNRDIWDALHTTDRYDMEHYNASATGYNSYREALEGFTPFPGKTYCQKPDRNTVHEIHNAVHIYTGGTMANVAASTNDPIFWLHHCMVDRVFEIFIKRNGETYTPTVGAPPGHNADDCMVPFYPLHRNKDYLKLSTEFGYQYDSLPKYTQEPVRHDRSQCAANLPTEEPRPIATQPTAPAPGPVSDTTQVPVQTRSSAHRATLDVSLVAYSVLFAMYSSTVVLACF
ncbi:tyrosinase-like [Sycon ciliatum]|uniref:tyrosinase-like n=1 Tax=Sycon ciliatum TaxID=27933 RepID=UPI0031F6AC5B